jgi:import inner membrane translocase subunit TIM50
MPILDKIDPLSYYFLYRLFRDSTRYFNGTLVKDLSYLGRDLSKVVILDCDPAHVQTNPENAIVLPPWKGDTSDTRLMAYLPFLEALFLNRVADVRPILSGYKDKDIPLEFAKRQAAFKESQLATWRQRKAEADKSLFGSFSLGALFGLGSKVTDEPPLTMLEAERKRYLDHYQKDVALFKENQASMMAQMEADRERQLKEWVAYLALVCGC